jgi:hypothetical protein
VKASEQHEDHSIAAVAVPCAQNSCFTMNLISASLLSTIAHEDRLHALTFYPTGPLYLNCFLSHLLSSRIVSTEIATSTVSVALANAIGPRYSANFFCYVRVRTNPQACVVTIFPAPLSKENYLKRFTSQHSTQNSRRRCLLHNRCLFKITFQQRVLSETNKLHVSLSR